MTEQIAIKDIQKIAEAMQGFKTNRPLLVSFLLPLQAMIDFLKDQNKRLADEYIGINEAEISKFEAVAKMFRVLCYYCLNNSPTPETITLAHVCSDMENICLTIAQHSKGVLNEDAGHFYASEQNLAELTEASLKVLEATNTKEPINFIQVD